MVINQGDVYWVDLGDLVASEPGFRHPHVVVQNDLFNESRIGTVVVCSLTSSLKRFTAPGNVTLKKGEAGLPKKSVVNISQLFTLNRGDLVEKIGTLSRKRIEQIAKGIQLLTDPVSV